METSNVTRTTMMAGTLALTVWPEAPAGEHQRYGYRIRDTATGQEIEGRDLFTGAGRPVEPDQAIRDLAGYLSAAGEARQYALDHPGADPENAGLFPAWVGDVARDNDAALSDLADWPGPVNPVTQHGPGEALSQRWLHVVFIDGGDEAAADIFEWIEAGDFEAAFDYLRQLDFGNDDLDDPNVSGSIEDEIALSASSQVTSAGEYVLVHDHTHEHISFYRQVPPASSEPEREPQRWISVVFLQGAEADDVLDLIDRQGTDAAIEHLAGYDYGEDTVQAALENGYVYDDLPTGTVDEVATRDVYTLSYNHSLGHVSLLREYDALPDPVLLGIDTPTPKPEATPKRNAPRSSAEPDWFGRASGRGAASGRGLGL